MKFYDIRKNLIEALEDELNVEFPKQYERKGVKSGRKERSDTGGFRTTPSINNTPNVTNSGTK